MEKQIAYIQSVTLILSGGLLQATGNMNSGWQGAVVSIAGFILFYIGLGNMAIGLDNLGKRAVNTLRMAALVGVIGGVLDLVPMMGVFASLLFVVAFVLEIFGFMQLKTSNALDMEGKNGAGQLMIANILAAVAALLSILPFAGGFLAALLYLIVLALAIMGWLKVQKSIISQGLSTEV